MMAGPTLSPEEEAGTVGQLQPQADLIQLSLLLGLTAPLWEEEGLPGLLPMMTGLLGKGEG